VTVRGVDSSGEPFEEKTVLVNLDAGGMYFCLPQTITLGSEIYGMIELPKNANTPRSILRVSVEGIVSRVEPWLDGTSGLAVRFTRHRVF
jgi:hypothetical protein